MKASDIIGICINAISIKSRKKYRQINFASDMSISSPQLSNIVRGVDPLGPTIAERMASALQSHDIQVTPGHILDGLTQDDWQLVPRQIEGGTNTESGEGDTMKGIVKLLAQVDDPVVLENIRAFISFQVSQDQEKTKQKNIHSA